MWSLLFASLLTGAPHDDLPATIALDVGQTITLDVGNAVGSQCDDDTVVRGEMETGPTGTNTFVVTGLHAGTTLCRVGLITGRSSILYRFDVFSTETPRTGPGAR